jgi:hypothetical protein
MFFHGYQNLNQALPKVFKTPPSPPKHSNQANSANVSEATPVRLRPPEAQSKDSL